MKSLKGFSMPKIIRLTDFFSNNKFLNSVKIPGLTLIDFKIFQNLRCIPRNYEKNVIVMKNRGTVIFPS